MARVEREIRYKCSDDCEMSGCPGHTGVLFYQSTSDAYSFNMSGRIMHFERGELQAMLDLLKSLDRADCIQVR